MVMMNQENRSGGKGLDLETMNPGKFIAGRLRLSRVPGFLIKFYE
jgi:hypothetical protein